jgi:hypothetical protein
MKPATCRGAQRAEKRRALRQNDRARLANARSAPHRANIVKVIEERKRAYGNPGVKP